ncbi:hypothetical protein [Clostridium aciditolerans]
MRKDENSPWLIDDFEI